MSSTELDRLKSRAIAIRLPMSTLGTLAGVDINTLSASFTGRIHCPPDRLRKIETTLRRVENLVATVPYALDLRNASQVERMLRQVAVNP